MATALSIVRARQRRASPAANRSPTAPATPTLRHPTDVGLNRKLQEHVSALRNDGRPTNTAKAIDTKIEEFFQYCDKVWSHEPFPHHLHFEKVYGFMWYQAFREQKKRGGNRKAIKDGILFDYADYLSVVQPTQPTADGRSTMAAAFPTPKKPIGMDQVNLYKSSMKRLHRLQVVDQTNSRPWETVWQLSLDELMKHVKERAPMIRKSTYQEKVSSEFAPYTIVEHYNEIEDLMWNDSDTIGRRSVCTNLRHRYSLLHLTSGILRCESLHRAEISDFMMLRPPKKDTDIHPMLLMINQIAQGKTNHGRLMYGRATRHRDVRLCCLGALAFYLMYRFDCTGEFKDMTINDWLDNSKWFDIKLLVDINTHDNTKEMQNDGYSDHIKRVLKLLALSCDKLCHLGRNLGSKILDLLEEESEEIRRMGQWNQSIFDNSYSSKLPMSPIRKLAGFFSNNKFYFNTRTAVKPLEALLRMTPIGEWVYSAFTGVQEQANGKHQTALHVLNFLKEINEIFLQDAAAMLSLHPERANHPLFSLPVFSSTEFKVSVRCMQDLLLS